MLDHLSWYLVEIERRLRRRHSEASAKTILMEVRSHLEERTEELAAGGLDRPAAVKSAVAEFGSPTYVASCFTSGRPLGRRLFLALIALIALMGSVMLPALIVASNDVAGFADMSRVDFLYAPLLTLISVAVMAYLTRRWVAPAVCVLVLCIGLGTITFFALNTQEIRIHGTSRLVYAPNVSREVELRSQWLRNYDQDVLTVRRLMESSGRNLISIIDAHLKVPGEGYLVPTLVVDRSYHFSNNRSLISSYSEPPSGWYPLKFGRQVAFALHTVPDLKSAVASWKQEGLAYAELLEQRATDLKKEVQSLTQPIDTSLARRWQTLGASTLAMVGMLSLVALAVNCLTLLLREGVDRWRRHVWKMQMG